MARHHPQAGAQLYSTFVKELEEVLGEERVSQGLWLVPSRAREGLKSLVGLWRA